MPESRAYRYDQSTRSSDRALHAGELTVLDGRAWRAAGRTKRISGTIVEIRVEAADGADALKKAHEQDRRHLLGG